MRYASKDMKLARCTIIDTLKYVDHEVELQGWLHSIRDMGKIAFIEVRDHTASVQVVVEDPKLLTGFGPEDVVALTGKVRARGERYVNKKLATGTVEVGLSKLSLLSKAAELPFELKKDTKEVHEELRLKHRYLDLRTERMQRNLRLRAKVNSFLRRSLEGQEFIEVETPLLTKGTPEGSREFLVPARLHHGEFYVLPQSPQQFKQLLMVGGVGRYYQIARCLRDEDQRGDRQPEFTQLDMEMSFATQEEIIQLNEKLLIELVQEVAPHKRITQTPFPRMTYKEAIDTYGTDKPDLRKDKNDPDELAFVWVIDFPMFEKNGSGELGASHHPFTAPLAEDADRLESDPLSVRASAYDVALNGSEIGGGSLRIHDAELQTRVFRRLGLADEEIKLRFGHMIEAFRYGVPPHGGIAWGLDRLIMILAGEPNIREVIAFPKTGDARDPLTGAPSVMPEAALAEAHIKTAPHPKNDTKHDK